MTAQAMKLELHSVTHPVILPLSVCVYISVVLYRNFRLVYENRSTFATAKLLRSQCHYYISRLFICCYGHFLFSRVSNMSNGFWKEERLLISFQHVCNNEVDVLEIAGVLALEMEKMHFTSTTAVHAVLCF